MPLYVADDSLRLQLDDLAARWVGFKTGLFVADRTFAPGDTAADYLPIEATFPGYARQPITAWTAAVVSAVNTVSILGTLCVWTRGLGGAPESVYGYFVVDASGRLRWAEKRPNGPLAFNSSGSTFSFSPSFASFRC